MADNNKPLFIGCGVLAGCGGCLLLIMLVVVPMGVFTWNITFPFVQTSKEMGRITEKIARLDAKYPFTPPEDGVIAPERLDVYLNVRGEADLYIGDRLSWVLRFADAQDASISGNFMNFMRLPGTLLGITTDLLDLLEENEMSFAEYRWLVLQTAAQLQHWTEYSDDGEIDRLANEYFAPIDTFHRKLTELEASGAGRVEMDGLDYNEFFGSLKEVVDPDINREQFERHAERLSPHPAIIFLDAWVIHLGVSNSVNIRVEDLRFGEARRLHQPEIPASIPADSTGD